MAAIKFAAGITLAGLLLSGAAGAADRRYLVDQTIPGGKAKVAAAAIEVECGPVRDRVKDLIDSGTPYNVCMGMMQQAIAFLGAGRDITSEMLNASAFTDDDRQRIIAATDARDRKLAEDWEALERKRAEDQVKLDAALSARRTETAAAKAKWDAEVAKGKARWEAAKAESKARIAERKTALEAKVAKRIAFFEERRKQRAARASGQRF